MSEESPPEEARSRTVTNARRRSPDSDPRSQCLGALLRVRPAVDV